MFELGYVVALVDGARVRAGVIRVTVVMYLTPVDQIRLVIQAKDRIAADVQGEPLSSNYCLWWLKPCRHRCSFSK